MLDRAYDPSARFTADEVALVEPIARMVAPADPVEEGHLRKSLATLAATLPAQASDGEGGRLKYSVYMKALAGADAGAVAYACRRCLEELDWFPTVHELRERIDAYMSEERMMIVRARRIVADRRHARSEEPVRPMSDEEIRRMSDDMRRLGLGCGALTQEQVDRALAGRDERVAA